MSHRNTESSTPPLPMDSAHPELRFEDDDPALISTIMDILQVMVMGQVIAPSEYKGAQEVKAMGSDLGPMNNEADIDDDIGPIGRTAGDGAADVGPHIIQATGPISGERLGDSFGQSNLNQETIVEAQELHARFISDNYLMLRPMKQPVKNSCMFAATIVTSEADSRRVSAGAEFPWKAAVPNEEFLKDCIAQGIFDPLEGVYFKYVGQMLEKVKKFGLPTENSDTHLWLKDWEIWWSNNYGREGGLTPTEAKRLLFDKGCLMGILFITSDYFNIEAPLDGGGEDSSLFISYSSRVSSMSSQKI